jgi:hypothetical protein
MGNTAGSINLEQVKVIDFDFSKPMKFEELRELDKKSKANYYEDWSTIPDAMSSGIVPQEYMGVFPVKCECGSEIIISNNRKHFTCCNPRCYVKMGYHMSEILSKLGVKNVGDETCKTISRNLYKTLKTHSPVEMLLQDYSVYEALVGPAKAMEIFRPIINLRGKSITFSTMIEYICIPGFGTDMALFKNFKELGNFVASVQHYGGVKELLEVCGINDTHRVFNLWICLTDILIMDAYLVSNIIHEGDIKYNICVTGSVMPNGEHLSNKERFIEMCNSFSDEVGNKIFDVRMTQAMETCDFVIADTVSSSAKYKAGLRRGVLMSSTDFLNYLNVEAEKWMQAQISQGRGQASVKMTPISSQEPIGLAKPNPEESLKVMQMIQEQQMT